MRFMRFFLLASCMVASAAAASSSAAQPSRPKAQKGVMKFPPPVTAIETPFSLNAPLGQRTESVEFRAAYSMNEQDRQTASGAMPRIRENAALAGFNLDKGGWSYRQIVCSVFPGHLLLFFSRENGASDVSEFSAILGRGGKGFVHILPILRRSYALSPPAPTNPLSIAAFNLIRDQENPHEKMDWVTTGLCYAALTGARVMLPERAGNRTQANVPLGLNPLLQVGADGSAAIRFDDLEAPQRPREWDLSFDSHGKLVQVAVTPVLPSAIKALP
jgi:hypothetical protein